MKSILLVHAGWLLLAAVSALAQTPEQPTTRKESAAREEALGALPRGLTAGTLRISPDGRHFAGAMVHGDKWTVYVDGVESSEYDAVTDDSIHFSADSKRLAYGAMRGGKGIVVVDGKEYPCGLACAKGFPIFDPSGAHFLYVAAHPGNEASVIVDGEEGQTWEALMTGGPTFCPDGKHFAYVAKDGDGARAVVNGVAGPKYQNVVAPTFGPNCQTVAYVALTPDASILVAGGQERVRTDNFVRDSLGFDSLTRLHILSIDHHGKIARWQLDLGTQARELQ